MMTEPKNDKVDDVIKSVGHVTWNIIRPIVRNMEIRQNYYEVTFSGSEKHKR